MHKVNSNSMEQYLNDVSSFSIFSRLYTQVMECQRINYIKLNVTEFACVDRKNNNNIWKIISRGHVHWRQIIQLHVGLPCSVHLVKHWYPAILIHLCRSIFSHNCVMFHEPVLQDYYISQLYHYHHHPILQFVEVRVLEYQNLILGNISWLTN